MPPRSRRASQGDVWTSAKENTLMDLLESNELLYNDLHADYDSDEKRHLVLEEMGKILDVSGVDVGRRLGVICRRSSRQPGSRTRTRGRHEQVLRRLFATTRTPEPSTKGQSEMVRGSSDYQEQLAMPKTTPTVLLYTVITQEGGLEMDSLATLEEAMPLNKAPLLQTLPGTQLVPGSPDGQPATHMNHSSPMLIDFSSGSESEDSEVSFKPTAYRRTTLDHQIEGAGMSSEGSPAPNSPRRRQPKQSLTWPVQASPQEAGRSYKRRKLEEAREGEEDGEEDTEEEVTFGKEEEEVEEVTFGEKEEGEKDTFEEYEVDEEEEEEQKEEEVSFGEKDEKEEYTFEEYEVDEEEEEEEKEEEVSFGEKDEQEEYTFEEYEVDEEEEEEEKEEEVSFGEKDEQEEYTFEEYEEEEEEEKEEKEEEVSFGEKDEQEEDTFEEYEEEEEEEEEEDTVMEWMMELMQRGLDFYDNMERFMPRYREKWSVWTTLIELMLDRIEPGRRGRVMDQIMRILDECLSRQSHGEDDQGMPTN